MNNKLMDKMSKQSYCDQILNILSDDPIDTVEIMNKLNLPERKKTYIAAALKKGMEKNKIEQIKNPTVKGRYLGHSYKKI